MKMENGVIKMYQLSFWFRRERFILDKLFDTFDDAEEYTKEVDKDTEYGHNWSIGVIYNRPEESQK